MAYFLIRLQLAILVGSSQHHGLLFDSCMLNVALPLSYPWALLLQNPNYLLRPLLEKGAYGETQ